LFNTVSQPASHITGYLTATHDGTRILRWIYQALDMAAVTLHEDRIAAQTSTWETVVPGHDMITPSAEMPAGLATRLQVDGVTE
jgi:hypothetical protein